MLPSKNRPRYLPTLTQVVTSAELAGGESSFSASAQEVSKSLDSEQLVQQIVQSLMPLVTARIQESVREIVDERLHHLEANMQLEVESMVRHAMNGCRDNSKQ
jgi:hypothetical protein